MTIFLICRHGETENNKRQHLMGWIDTPLTEEGKRNAESTASKLKNLRIDQIVSSDLGRAFMTAYLVSKHIGYSSSIEAVSGLREMNYGDLANLPYDVYPKLTPEENASYIPPHGESLSQMRARVLRSIEQLAAKYDGKTVLVVAHDGTINAIRASYRKSSMGLEDKQHNAHDFVAKFEWNEGQITSFVELTK